MTQAWGLQQIFSAKEHGICRDYEGVQVLQNLKMVDPVGGWGGGSHL